MLALVERGEDLTTAVMREKRSERVAVQVGWSGFSDVAHASAITLGALALMEGELEGLKVSG